METRQGWSDGYLPAAGEEVQVFRDARPHLTFLCSRPSTILYNIKLKFFSRSRTKTYSSIYPALKMLQIPLGKYLDPFEM